jgi:periplasmic protein TonB
MRLIALPALCIAWPASAETGIAVTNVAQPPVTVAVSPPALPIHLPPPYVIQQAPPPLAPHIVRAPEARRLVQDYVSAEDYPEVARVTRQQGRVEVRLEIGPNGRAVGCIVTSSSGSSALDSTTCSLLRRRARFTPAGDSNGNPVTGTIDQEIEWRLPTDR